MVLSAIPIKASAETQEQRTVRVGYYEAAGFQEYDAETKTYSGYGYEFLMALQQYTNWKYEFVPCGFSEGLTMLQNGELDLMNNVSKTDERKEILDFSSIETGENIAYLAMKHGDTRVAYNDLKAMETIKIGLAKDNLYSDRLVQYFEKKNVSANILWFDSRDEVTDAFNSGKVDAYIITSSINSDEHLILSFSPDSYYIATTKGNDDFTDEIDSAISSFRSNDPYFELHLKEKYFGKSDENYTILTNDEKQYLEENPVARVMYVPDWYPICYQDKNGDFSGALRSVYDLLEERTGIKFEYVAVPGDYESDDVLGDFDAQIMAEQPTDFSGSGLYDVKLSRSFITPSLTEVGAHVLKTGDTIALVEGDYFSEVCQKVYGDDYNYAYFNSIEDCLKAVTEDKVDGTVLISYEAEFFRQNHKYSQLTYNIIDVGSYSLSIAVSNSADPRLYAIIQKGLNSISTGEISNIFNNTLNSLRDEGFIANMYNNPFPTLIIAVTVFSLLVGMILSFIFMKRLKVQNQIINEKNIALANANQATTDFFSRMSHDMRTPMNGIMGIAKLSEDETDPDILKNEISKIEHSGEYLLSLINDTLDFQRIQSGRLQLVPEIVSANVILKDIIAMVKPAADAKHINLKVDTINEIPDCYIKADSVRVKQIFINLISNANKFTPEGGTISLEYECLSRENLISHVRFFIRDTGVGMSQDFINNNLFKPFSQEHNEVTNQYAGSGLGLSIVKSLVELMGGTISAESEQGVGTTFTLCLDFERVLCTANDF